MIVMKRYIILILLLAIYLPGSAGIAISAHFCMGELASLSINTAESKSCACTPGFKKSCCSDTFIYYKLDINQTKAENLKATFKFSFSCLPPFIIPSLELANPKAELPNVVYDYPPHNRTILFNVFRI
jgi:hypothetical protein